MATFGPIMSSAPNQLFDAARTDAQVQAFRRNALMMDREQRQSDALGQALANASPADRLALGSMDPSQVGQALFQRGERQARQGELDRLLQSFGIGGTTGASPSPAPGSLAPIAGAPHAENMVAPASASAPMPQVSSAPAGAYQGGAAGARVDNATAAAQRDAIMASGLEGPALEEALRGISLNRASAMNGMPANTVSTRDPGWEQRGFAPAGGGAPVPTRSAGRAAIPTMVTAAPGGVVDVSSGRAGAPSDVMPMSDVAPVSDAGFGTRNALAPAPVVRAPVPAGGGENDPRRAQVAQLRQRALGLGVAGASIPGAAGIAAQFGSQADALERQIEGDRVRADTRAEAERTRADAERRALADRQFTLANTPPPTVVLGEGAPEGPGTYERRRDGTLRRLGGTPPPSSQVTVDQRGEGEEAKRRGQNLAEQGERVRLASEAAAGTVDTIRQVRAIGAETDRLAPAREALGGWLDALGVPASNSAAVRGAASLQQFNAVASNFVLGKQMEQRGVQTDGDRAVMQATFASATNTNEANAVIMRGVEAQANRVMERAEFFEQWRAAPGDDSRPRNSYGGANEAWNAYIRTTPLVARAGGGITFLSEFLPSAEAEGLNRAQALELWRRQAGQARPAPRAEAAR